MISTICPGCAAKFQVPDDLVSGKLVRFRCRKCGGTIAVDGTAPSASSAPPAPAASPANIIEQSGRKKTLVFGQKIPESELRPQVPGTMLHGVAIDTSKPKPDDAPLSRSEIQPQSTMMPNIITEGGAASSEPAQKFDLERTPAPPAMQDKWNLPPEPVASKGSTDTSNAPTATINNDLAGTPKPPVSKLAEPVKTPDPPAVKPAARAFDEKAKPGIVASAPKKKRDIFDVGNDAVAAADPNKSVDRPKPAPPKPAASQQAKGEKAEGAKRLEGPSSKRSARISMELGSVFAVPDKGSKGDKSDDMDVEIDLDAVEEKPLNLEPIIAVPPKPKPPAPQLKKVVLDVGDAGMGDAPESRPMPSVAFFSPVMIPQMQLSTPPVQSLLEAPKQEADEKPAPMKSGQGMIWAAIIASAGVLGAGGYLLWSQLHSDTPPQSRTGAVAEPQFTTAPTQAPTRASTPESTASPVAPADTSSPAASVAAASKAAAPSDPASRAKPDETKKEPTPAAGADTTKKVASTPGGEPPTPAPAETKTVEPPSATPTKQPQPTEASEVAFDKSAAASAIAARKGSAAGCKQEGGPTGHAKVSITFAPSGRVTTANIAGPPFAGTPVGGCVASKFRSATVPPFSGGPVTVHTTVAIF
jgi:hypothetical protein